MTLLGWLDQRQREQLQQSPQYDYSKECKRLRSAVGWRQSGVVSVGLLAAAGGAGAAAAWAIAWASAAPAGASATGVASAREASATVAAAEAALVAPVVCVRRRHRGDGIVALPGTSFKLQDVHPRSSYVEGLVANYLLEVRIGLAPLELYFELALELPGVVLFLRHDEGSGYAFRSGAASTADAVDEVVRGVGQVVVDDVSDVLH